MPGYTLDLWRVVEFDAPNDEAARGEAAKVVGAVKAATGFSRVHEHEVEVRRKVGRAQVHHEFAGEEAAA